MAVNAAKQSVRLRGVERQLLRVQLGDRDRQVGVLDHRPFVGERDVAGLEAVADAFEPPARETERAMRGPNGEPLYAARWYREPTDQELAGYLSTARSPGVALIACKTVAGYYVEDCVLESEGPQGSMMGRAVLAAAWQFRVRPARINGREQFGSWVRIRIDYSIRKAKR